MQLRTMDDELALVKTCILQLYTGRQLAPPVAPPHAQPAPAALPPPSAAAHVFASAPGAGAAGHATTKLF